MSEASKPAQPPLALFITALIVEHRAVREMIKYEGVERISSGEICDKGSFGQWKVVIVQVGQGNVPAAVVTSRTVQFFKPTVVFFVGVAGGIKDVALGDVVAALRVHAYESGKEGADGFLPRSDPALVTFRVEQSANAVARNSEWQWRVKPKAGDSNPPRSFVGAIVAGAKVVGDRGSATYRLIHSYYSDALAVDMEDYGFLAAARAGEVHALAVRGISDLIDNKETSDAAGCQERAAHHASAFAFEVLAQWPTDETASSNRADSPSRDEDVPLDQLRAELVDLYTRCDRDGIDPTTEPTIILLNRRIRQRSPALDAGDLLDNGRYLLSRPIGRGRLTTVWLAEDRLLGGTVAVKLLDPRFQSDRTVRDRFINAVSRMKRQRLNGVLVPEVGNWAGHRYLVMEYIPRSLEHAVGLDRAITPGQALNIVLDAGRILGRAGLHHHNIRPSNILLSAKNEPMLTDFGLLSLHPADGELFVQEAADPYAAEEVLQALQSIGGDTAAAAADVFSLGMTAIFAIWTRHPSRSLSGMGSLQHCFSCPSELESVLLRAIAPHEEDRYPSVLQFCDELAKAATVADKIDRLARLDHRTRTLNVASLLMVDDAAAIRQAPTLMPQALHLPDAPVSKSAGLSPFMLDVLQQCDEDDDRLQWFKSLVIQRHPRLADRFEPGPRSLHKEARALDLMHRPELLFHQLCSADMVDFEALIFRLGLEKEIAASFLPRAHRVRAVLSRHGVTLEDRRNLSTRLLESKVRADEPLDEIPTTPAGAALLLQISLWAIDNLASVSPDTDCQFRIAQLRAATASCQMEGARELRAKLWPVLLAERPADDPKLVSLRFTLCDLLERVAFRIDQAHLRCAIIGDPSRRYVERVPLYRRLCALSREQFDDIVSRCGIPRWCMASEEEPQSIRAVQAITFRETWWADPIALLDVLSEPNIGANTRDPAGGAPPESNVVNSLDDDSFKRLPDAWFVELNFAAGSVIELEADRPRERFAAAVVQAGRAEDVIGALNALRGRLSPNATAPVPEEATLTNVQLHEQMTRISPQDLDRVAEALGIPHAYLPAPWAPPIRRAQDVLQICQNIPGGLSILARHLAPIKPLEVSANLPPAAPAEAVASTSPRSPSS